MTEEVLLFGAPRSLVGILTRPDQAATARDLPAVVFINAGVLHRVGPNCLYVKIARALAGAGYVVLRFDLSGVGDSPARRDNLPFEKSALAESQEAMSCLSAVAGVRTFVLSGLCSGAHVSLKTACLDPRVVGVVLINTMPDEQSIEDTPGSRIASRQDARYYLGIALFSAKSWLRVLTGKANYRAIAKTLRRQLDRVLGSSRPPSLATKRAAADYRLLIDRGVRLLFICSARDPGLDYINDVIGDQLDGLCSSGKAELHVIPRSDHTFTLIRDQELVVKLMSDWMQAMAAEGTGQRNLRTA
jgi:pimeloyl-ACP methyl ester carboxylesterase